MAYYEELSPALFKIISERVLRNQDLCKLLYYYPDHYPNYDFDPLAEKDIENTNALKGLLALGVILSHLSSVVENQVPGFSVSSFGYICVGCFFSLSGYALVVSQEKNENYFIGFLVLKFAAVKNQVLSIFNFFKRPTKGKAIFGSLI